MEKIVLKKVSPDLDVALHKRLKHIVFEKDLKLYELVKNMLDDYVKRKN